MSTTDSRTGKLTSMLGHVASAVLAVSLAIAMGACGGSGAGGDGSSSAPVSDATSATASDMRLEAVEGTVGVSDENGEEISVREGMKIFSGNVVSTEQESYAYVELDSTKVIKLDASSKAQVRKQGEQLEITLSEGKLFFNATEPLSESESMNIRTSTMVTGIRGTSGYVTVDGNTSSVTILDGAVEIHDPIAEVNGEYETTRVEAGQTATVNVSSGERVWDVTLEDVTVDDIPGFVAVELAADESLQERVRESSGLAVDQIVAGAAERLAADEAAAREAAEASDGSGSRGETGAPSQGATAGAGSSAGTSSGTGSSSAGGSGSAGSGSAGSNDSGSNSGAETPGTDPSNPVTPDPDTPEEPGTPEDPGTPGEGEGDQPGDDEPGADGPGEGETGGDEGDTGGDAGGDTGGDAGGDTGGDTGGDQSDSVITSSVTESELKELLGTQGSVTIASGGSVSIDGTSGEGVSLASGQTLTVQGGGSLSVSGSLTVGAGAQLVIESGASLTNSGTIAVEEGGTISVSGSYTGAVPTGAGTVDGLLWYPEGAAVSVDADGAYHLTSGEIDGATLSGWLSTAGNEKIALVVDSGATVTVDTSETVSIASGQSLTVSGTLTNNGSVTNAGALAVSSGGGLANNGTLANSGTFAVETGGTFSGNLPTGKGSVSGIDMALVVTNALSGAQLQGLLDSYGSVSLTVSSVTVGSSESVTVGSGKTLTVATDGTLAVEQGGSLTVSSGAALANNGTLSNNGTLTVEAGGTLTNTGTYVGTSPAGDGTITGVAQLPDGMAYGADGDLHVVGTVGADALSSVLSGTVGSFSKVVVDPGASVTIASGESVQVPSGKELAVEGTLSNAGTLTNGGTLTVSGALTNSGAIANTGSLTVGAGGTLANNGTLDNSGTLTAAGGTYTGLVPTGTGTVTGLLWFPSGASISVDANGAYHLASGEIDGATLSGWLSTAGNEKIALVVDSGATVTVASGEKVSIASGQSLTVSGTLTNNGSISSEGALTIESGGAFSGNIPTGLGTMTDNSTTEYTFQSTATAGQLQNALSCYTNVTIGVSEETTDGVSVEVIIGADESVTVPSGKTLTIAYKQISENVAAYGCLTNYGTLFNEGTIVANGDFNNGDSENYSSATFTNKGEFIDGFGFSSHGIIHNAADATLTLNNYCSCWAGTLTNEGSLTCTGQIAVKTDVGMSSSGTITLENGALNIDGTLTLTGGSMSISGTCARLSNSGTLSVEAEAKVINNTADDGTATSGITNTGTIKVNGSIQNFGGMVNGNGDADSVYGTIAIASGGSITNAATGTIRNCNCITSGAYNTIAIEEGAKLTNVEGGAITNCGLITVAGTLTNDGMYIYKVEDGNKTYAGSVTKTENGVIDGVKAEAIIAKS